MKLMHPRQGGTKVTEKFVWWLNNFIVYISVLYGFIFIPLSAC